MIGLKRKRSEPKDCTTAIKEHSYTTLKQLVNDGCKLNKTASLEAALVDDVECLKYTIKHGCLNNKRVLYAAVRGESYNCLNYIKNKTMIRNSNAINIALRKGNLRLLKYLLEELKLKPKNILYPMKSICAHNYIDCLTYMCVNHYDKVFNDTSCDIDWKDLADLATDRGYNECATYLYSIAP